MNIRNNGKRQTLWRMSTILTLSLSLSLFAFELIHFIGGINAFSFQKHSSLTTLPPQIHVSFSQKQLYKGATGVAVQSRYQSQQTKLDLSHNSLGTRTTMLSPQQTVWTRVQTVVFDSPESAQPLAHLGENFPLTLLGNIQWVKGQRWAHISWSSPTYTWNGWIAESSITFVSSGDSGSASFDALSPELASYLSSFSSHLGVSLYDVTHQRYYLYNGNLSFLMASSVKVPIMFTYLDQLEQQHTEPDDQAINELSTMIENSDNDSASDLYSQINGASGMNTFLHKIGVSEMKADDDAWGYSMTTPLAMIHLFTRFYSGTILNRQDRSLAMNLMENIEADQRQGLGNMAPQGTRVAMKNGWVPASDGSWAVNTSGIVMSNNETYILAVYVQDQPSQEIGQNVLQHVCSLVNASLL